MIVDERVASESTLHGEKRLHGSFQTTQTTIHGNRKTPASLPTPPVRMIILLFLMIDNIRWPDGLNADGVMELVKSKEICDRTTIP